MSALFAPPSIPTPTVAPAPPKLNDENVQKQVDAEARRPRAGRASTFLTDPQTQRDADPNAQRFLGGL